MPTHEEHILRILGQATEPLFPSEITDRLNRELGAGSPYTMTEIVKRLQVLEEATQVPDGRLDPEAIDTLTLAARHPISNEGSKWTAKAITRFRKSLESRHRELRVGVAKGQEETLTAQHDYGKDDGDRANTSLARELHLGQKSRDRALLSAVDAALKRISEGTFGECLNCGQEINVKRLEALPWVRYCITCQELIDGT